MLSGLTFTSKAAKEHLKSEKVKLDKPDKKSKGKRPKVKIIFCGLLKTQCHLFCMLAIFTFISTFSISQDKGLNAEVKINDTKLILDLPPEPTENDPEADRILYKLQRKIK